MNTSDLQINQIFANADFSKLQQENPNLFGLIIVTISADGIRIASPPGTPFHVLQATFEELARLYSSPETTQDISCSYEELSKSLGKFS